MTLEGLAALKPVFRPDGEVTAGNACPLNDGAAAVVVMSDTRANELGVTPLARIVSSGVSALNPEIMGLGPIEASRQALARAGKTIDDIDLVEINEAFAAQVIPSAKHLGIDLDKLNVHGGAIALGHPFGMTGRADHDHPDPRPPGDWQARSASRRCVSGAVRAWRWSSNASAEPRTTPALWSAVGEGDGVDADQAAVAAHRQGAQHVALPAAREVGEIPRPRPVGAIAVEVDHPVDVEAGVLRLGLPQRDQPTTQPGIVEQVRRHRRGAARAT